MKNPLSFVVLMAIIKYYLRLEFSAIGTYNSDVDIFKVD